MAYTQILKALHRNLQQAATQYSVQKSKLTQVSSVLLTHRTVSTVSRLTFHRRVGAPACVQPALSCFVQTQRWRAISLDFTARNKSSPEERDKSVYRYQGASPKPSAAQKVKEAGRDFTYLIVVLIGLGVTGDDNLKISRVAYHKRADLQSHFKSGGLLYVVFQELFSSSSPNKIYGKAFNKVKLHPEVIGAFGEPIKCYGETTRRGRRQQVSHMEYLKDGLKHMRLTFYIEGSEPGLKGTVHSESKENPETGKYEFRYIFVDIDTYPRRTIIVEDNR